MPMGKTLQTALLHLAHVAVKDVVMEDGRISFALVGQGRRIDYVNLLGLLHSGCFHGDVTCEVSGQYMVART